MRSDLPPPAQSRPEPVWPGFPPQALRVIDLLGGDTAIENERGRHQLVHPGVPEIDSLHRVLSAISRCTDAPSAVRTALRESLATTGATAGSLWLFQHDGSIARAAHAGLTREYMRAYAGAPDWADVQSEVSRLADVEVLDDGDLPWLPEHHQRMTPMLGLRSMAVIPLRTRGLRMGSIVLGHSQAGWFRNHSLEFLRTLGELVASALDNARLIAELQGAVQRNAELVHSAHDAIVFCDAGRRVTEANPALEALLGRTREELLGRDLFEFFAGAVARDEETFRRLVDRGVPVVGEFREMLGSDGSRVPVIVNGARVLGSGGETRGAVLTMRDERQGHSSRDAVPRPHVDGEDILASLDTGVALVSGGDLAVLECNPAFARLVSGGEGELPARGSLAELLPGGASSPVVAAVQRATREGRRVAEADVAVRRPGGDAGFWNVVATPVLHEAAEAPPRCVLTLVDVTERRALDERYFHAQKMEAVGTLAGGIAHEFNNLLTAILGQVSLALFDLPADHPLAPGLRDSQQAALRAADLTRQLLEFSRRSLVRLSPTDLRDAVEQALPLVHAAIDPRITIDRREEEDLWPVMADAAQLGQALMNLCLNARDAMPAGGQLQIALRNLPGDPAEGGHGDCVVLEVSDSGEGMTPEVRARIFEPFFTTRGPGRGTGLGLAVVHSIVEQHAGWIECDSQPRQGTIIRIGLPRANELPNAAAPPRPAPRGNGEVVLVVDDEEAVRNLTRSVLERSGYEVLLAADGAGAIEVFRAHRDRIAVVLLDQTMPEMSGPEALAAIRAIAPQVPVWLTSGYGRPEDVAGGPAALADGFLAKPFSPEEVASAVGAALASRR